LKESKQEAKFTGTEAMKLEKRIVNVIILVCEEMEERFKKERTQFRVSKKRALEKKELQITELEEIVSHLQNENAKLKEHEQEFMLVKNDLKSIIKEDKAVKFKSSTVIVQEVWRLVKRLRLAEDRLENKIQKLKIKKDQEEASKETCISVETIRREIPSPAVPLLQIKQQNVSLQNQRLDELANECSAVIQSAKKELSVKDSIITSLQNDINLLNEKIENLAKQCKAGENECARWMESSAFLASFFIGIHQKWVNFLTIKCCFWELAESVFDSYEQDSSSLSYKFFEVRKCFWAILFSIRLRRTLLSKQQMYKKNNDTQLILNNSGSEMYKRLMVISSFTSNLTSELVNLIRTRESNGEAFKAYFSKPRAILHQSNSFRLISIGKNMENTVSKIDSIEEKRVLELEGEIDDYKEKIEHLDRRIKNSSELILQAHQALQLKDTRIKELEALIS